MAVNFEDSNRGAGSGSASAVQGEVANFAALPSAASVSGQTYRVLAEQGTWILGTLKRAGDYYSDGATWTHLGTSSQIVKAYDTSTTDNAVVKYHSTDGQSIQESGVVIDDSDNVTGVNSLTATTIAASNVDPAADDEILIRDTSDSNNLKSVTVSDMFNLAVYEADATTSTITLTAADRGKIIKLTNSSLNQNIYLPPVSEGLVLGLCVDNTIETIYHWVYAENGSGHTINNHTLGVPIDAKGGLTLFFSDGSQWFSLRCYADPYGLSSDTPASNSRFSFQPQSGGWNTKYTTLSTLNGVLNHDSLNGFVANEHIDWTSTTSNFSTSGSITGTGVVDFGGATSLEIPNGAAPTVNSVGEIALDTSVTDFSTDVIKFYGSEEQGIVSMPIAQFTSPTDGHVVTYNATNDEFELAAGGGGAGSPDGTNFVNTRYIGHLDAVGTTTGSFFSADTLYYIPVVIGTSGTFTRIGVNVTTAFAASEVVRMGIYDLASDGRPGNLVVDGGTVVADSTGEKEVTISETLQGKYYVAITVESTTGNLTRFTVESLIRFGGFPSGSSGTDLIGYSQSTVDPASALPSSAGTLTEQTGLLPHVYVRIA